MNNIVAVHPEQEIEIKTKAGRVQHLFAEGETSFCGKHSKKDYRDMEQHPQRRVEAQKILATRNEKPVGGKHCDSCVNRLEKVVSEEKTQKLTIPDETLLYKCKHKGKVWGGEEANYCPFCGKDISYQERNKYHEVEIDE